MNKNNVMPYFGAKMPRQQQNISRCRTHVITQDYVDHT
jgi:hypothetical protein